MISEWYWERNGSRSKYRHLFKEIGLLQTLEGKNAFDAAKWSVGKTEEIYVAEAKRLGIDAHEIMDVVIRKQPTLK